MSQVILESNVDDVSNASVPELIDIADTRYITTAITYTNGYAHIGHAYEFVCADVIARYYRILGFDVFFLTGSDEHGQKVAASAEKSGIHPKEHCDFYVDALKELHKKLNISYDRFIRTTDDDHIAYAQRLWCKCSDAGDIYLGSYHGWYNEREECYVTDMEAEVTNFCDSGTGLPLKKVVEESYFFRMSTFRERLIAHIENNSEFIQPEQFKNNILVRLRTDELKDLSISRTSFAWGIPVPPDFDQRHVMYVWFDALVNYLSGVQALDLDMKLSRYWPASVHIIGKDIIWFHCVIWPCMLMSAGLELPKTIFSHGFINAEDGRKMSKSFNNSVDPKIMTEKYSSDSIRYYMCSSITFGADLNFSESTLVSSQNSELADIVGNMVHRVLNLAVKYCESVIPEYGDIESITFPFDIETLRSDVKSDLDLLHVNTAICRGMEAARATNIYLTRAEPWKVTNIPRRVTIVRVALEALYVSMHFLAPVIPLATEKVFQSLGTPPTTLNKLKVNFSNLNPGSRITLGDILFGKIDVPSPSPKDLEAKVDASCDLSSLNIIVAKILRVWNHETSIRLFCVELDVNDIVKTSVIPLRETHNANALVNQLVVAVTNIKETKVAGFLSSAIVITVLTADGRQDIVNPATSSKVGERVFFDGCKAGEPLPASTVKKLKVWENVKKDMKTEENGDFTWKQKQLRTSGAQCKSLPNACVV